MDSPCWYSTRILLCIGFAFMTQAGCAEDPKEPIVFDYWMVVDGTVRDSASIAAIAGVQIYDAYVEPVGPPIAVTDSAGYFRFDFLGRELQGSIGLRAAGYYSRSYDLALSADSLGPMHYRVDAYLRRR
jgi:hypothetical protein